MNSDISSGTEQVSLSRRYHPGQGRWISPDNIIPNLLNPQTFNAYHYALNRPNSVTDPSGLVDINPGMLYAETGGSAYGLWAATFIASQLASGAAVQCPASGCMNLRQDPENGQWEILAGYQTRTALNLDGSTYQTQAPIWTDYIPPSGYSPGSTMPTFQPYVPSIPIVTAYHPPIPNVTAVGPKPQPPKPSPVQCFTNPSDAVDQMTENANQPTEDPNFPSQIYMNGNRGQRQLNPEGEAEGNIMALIVTGMVDFIGCLANAL